MKITKKLLFSICLSVLIASGNESYAPLGAATAASGTVVRQAAPRIFVHAHMAPLVHTAHRLRVPVRHMLALANEAYTLPVFDIRLPAHHQARALAAATTAALSEWDQSVVGWARYLASLPSAGAIETVAPEMLLDDPYRSTGLVVTELLDEATDEVVPSYGSGALIDEKTVLTAGHVISVHGKKTLSIKFYPGLSNAMPGLITTLAPAAPEGIYAAKYTRHEKWAAPFADEAFDHDIGTFELVAETKAAKKGLSVIATPIDDMPIVSIGYPFGLPYMRRAPGYGVLSGNLFLTSSSIFGGFSGGPMYGHGGIVGVVSRARVDKNFGQLIPLRSSLPAARPSIGVPMRPDILDFVFANEHSVTDDLFVPDTPASELSLGLDHAWKTMEEIQDLTMNELLNRIKTELQMTPPSLKDVKIEQYLKMLTIFGDFDVDSMRKWLKS